MSAAPQATLRIARPSDELERVAEQYRLGLGLAELGSFRDHDGFDGVMLGHPEHAWHLEFTSKRGHTVGRAPSEDNLLVLYLPREGEWLERARAMRAAGFLEVPAFNPYWDGVGVTFEDCDGYRVVLSRQAWKR